MIRSLYTSVSGMMNSATRMDIIGNNIANANTVAFKSNSAAVATSFDDASRTASTSSPVGMSVGLGSQIVGTVRQFTQGALQRTDVPTDLAIQGKGFFAVQNSNAENYVTRAGNFVTDELGNVRSMDGMFLLGTLGGTFSVDGVFTPAGTYTEPSAAGTTGFPADRMRIPKSVVVGTETRGVQNFSIGRDGMLSVVDSRGETHTIGHVVVMDYTNPNGLKERGNNIYEVSVAAGDNRYLKAGSAGVGQIAAGSLELSNVDLAREFSDMIVVQRSFEANARTISTSDEMLQTVTNIKR